jgi:hypothetical protein
MFNTTNTTTPNFFPELENKVIEISNNTPSECSSIINSVKYKSVIQNQTHSETEAASFSALDTLLENEKQQNKKDAWNKIDKTVKIQKLHEFAERYGKDNSLPTKDIKNLKLFFIDSLDKAKLQKTKDVIYEKEKGIITSIPALFFNSTNRMFTLRNMDAKRVSTLKSLTPKKLIKEKDE